MNSAALTSDETDALRTSIRSALQRHEDPEKAACDIGFVDLLRDVRPALGIFFEELGQSGLANSLADLLVREVLGLDVGHRPCLAYPLPAPGNTEVVAVSNRAGTITVDALIRVNPGAQSDQVLLRAGPGPEAVIAALSNFTINPAAGFDPTGGWKRITGNISTGDLHALAADAWPTAVALTQLAFGGEMLGVSSRILDTAIGHVSSRHQFGKPLASFQSVRHRLAEAHVAIQGARAVLDLGWRHADESERSNGNQLVVLAMAAKALAGHAFEAASRHAMQVCGGMGLTWEHPLPRLVRRGHALDVLLGSPVELTAQLGHLLAANTVLPLPDPLLAADG